MRLLSEHGRKAETSVNMQKLHCHWPIVKVFVQYLVATWLEWLDRIPSRCVQRCGKWWLVWLCSLCVPTASWRWWPHRKDWGRRTPVQMPAGKGCLVWVLSWHYEQPGRLNTRWFFPLCSEEVPKTGELLLCSVWKKMQMNVLCCVREDKHPPTLPIFPIQKAWRI